MTDEKSAVLILGATGGIGSECCRAFARAGHTVLIHYHQNKDRAAELEREVLSSGGEAASFQADLSSIGAIERMFHLVRENHRQVEHLVNCVGAILRPAGFQEISDENWDNTFAVNLKAIVSCVRCALPLLRNTRNPTITNIGSIFGTRTAAPAVLAYAAAKAGVSSITQSLARELGPLIRVNCVLPGIIDTKMSYSSPEQVIRNYIDRSVLKRIGTPYEIAEAIFFLTRATYMTGQCIVLDGGFSIA